MGEVKKSRKKKTPARIWDADKDSLAEILKDERDKEIEELREENARWEAEAERIRTEQADLWRKLHDERESHEASLLSLQQSRQQDSQKYVEAVAWRDAEIHKFKERMSQYATWVSRILACDVSIQPPEVALSRTAFMLDLLSASFHGATLEQAMASLGYLETVFGFEADPSPNFKYFVRIAKTNNLYDHETGSSCGLNPPSTKIRAIKELREHLNLGLAEAKNIVDALTRGDIHIVGPFQDSASAHDLANRLDRCSYFCLKIEKSEARS